ncbi:hypothetical protein P3T24_006454 [Paraburkholderia sp. GAS33]|jgi:hypothetical protein
MSGIVEIEGRHRVACDLTRQATCGQKQTIDTFPEIVNNLVT